ncbi:MAG: 4-hydroxythreonine-4-phosphate dehydrogenase PdxA [Thermodesulfobacteriota bacterium]
MKPKIAITMGDPAGIGPEILLKALNSRRVKKACTPVVVGSPAVLSLISKKTSYPLSRSIEIVDPLGETSPDPSTIKPGKLPKIWARAVVAYIEEAVRLAVGSDVDAIVTAPINKAALSKAGFSFPGHTEFLAHLTGTKDYVMMLGGERLKVALVTIHVPLKDVPKLITPKEVFKVIRITDEALKKRFRIKRPRIAVAGLNPHAGEAGLFGDEEARLIMPAVRRARRARIKVTDPIAPDTVFFRAVNGEFDCVVCMYHDQGLGPLKLIHFEDGFNATLGLPIIRTSVDHGTAYGLAWKAKASAESMITAILTAARMAG